MSAAETLLLVNASATLVQDAQRTLRRAKDGAMTGANLVWLSEINMWNGLLTNDTGLVARAVGYMFGEIRVSHRDGDNIQVDGSFHQHGPQLLAGSYGSAYTTSLLRIIAHTQGTPWQLSSTRLATLSLLILDGQQWMLDPQAAWDWQVQ